jgi:hypothetical protein
MDLDVGSILLGEERRCA